MRKMVIIIMMTLLLGNMQNYAFADTDYVKSAVTNVSGARYVSINNVYTELGISNDIAAYSVTAIKKIDTSIGYIEGTLKLIRTSTGSVVKTTRGNMYASADGFKLSDTKALTIGGEYHVEYILKVYKSGKVVETITGKSKSVRC